MRTMEACWLMLQKYVTLDQVTKRTISRRPGPGDLMYPRSRIPTAPRPNATNPMTRAAVPKPGTRMIPSQGTEKTNSHRKKKALVANTAGPSARTRRVEGSQRPLVGTSVSLKADRPGEPIRQGFTCPRADPTTSSAALRTCEHHDVRC